MNMDEALGHAWFNDIIIAQTPLPPTSTATNQQSPVPVYMPGETPLHFVDGQGLPRILRRPNGNRVRSERPILNPPRAKVYSLATESRGLSKRKAEHLDNESPMDGCDEPGPSGANANDSDTRRVKPKISESSQPN